ncbi:hypothetical protein B0H13DRAFT_2677163 [Mycena leptocephala]|nr:hypothetical protein B0H13DRAFT_2677163 [Mycena leptocephala]
MFSVPGTRFSIPCRRRFYTAARTDIAPWEMTVALARFPFRYHTRTHPVSISFPFGALLLCSFEYPSCFEPGVHLMISF